MPDYFPVCHLGLPRAGACPPAHFLHSAASVLPDGTGKFAWRLHQECHSQQTMRNRSAKPQTKRRRAMAQKARKRRYSPSAGRDVGREMHLFKRGKLKSGRGGKGGTVK